LFFVTIGCKKHPPQAVDEHALQGFFNVLNHYAMQILGQVIPLPVTMELACLQAPSIVEPSRPLLAVWCLSIIIQAVRGWCCAVSQDEHGLDDPAKV
jgi:hypothetical protein